LYFFPHIHPLIGNQKSPGGRVDGWTRISVFVHPLAVGNAASVHNTGNW